MRQIIASIGDYAEDWSWHGEAVEDLGPEVVLRVAAEALGMSPEEIVANEDLYRALRLP